MGECEKKSGNGGNITANRSRDVFQNIFTQFNRVQKFFENACFSVFQGYLYLSSPCPPIIWGTKWGNIQHCRTKAKRCFSKHFCKRL